MAKPNQVLTGIQKIYITNTLATAIFHFVQGVKAVHPEISLYLAIKTYANRFCPELDVNIGITIYQRQLALYKKTTIPVEYYEIEQI